MATIQCFTFNPFAENTYIVFDETREAAIIDPGCYEDYERRALNEFIQHHQLTIKYLLNTHCHIDHVLGNFYVKEKYKVPLSIYPAEEPVLRAVKTYASNYGFHNFQEAGADNFFHEGEVIEIGQSKWEVIFLPGHSPGHVGFYNKLEKTLISGDVLFERSIGRTDLPGGNFQILINSIHQKLFTLPDDVVVYPGHGDTTTIGEEKIENPFCALNINS